MSGAAGGPVVQPVGVVGLDEVGQAAVWRC